jgi:TRAP-type mannitol/chloroaromatic compound transport system substrate-binding protein
MKRRRFLLAGAAGLAAGVAAPALAQNKRELRLVTTWPKGMPGVGTGAERLGKRITEMSDGELTVKVYAAGELIQPFDVFDAVSSGRADLYHSTEYNWQGKSPAFAFFSGVPFGLTAEEMNGWIRQEGAQAIWDDLSKQFGVKPFLAGNTGMGLGGWFTKEIKTPKDFAGLKIHMPGLGGEVLRRMGATAITLPDGEVYRALESGVIDAASGLGAWNDVALGFYKVAKFCYYPSFNQGTALSLGVNLKLWEGLTNSQKRVIEGAAAAENSEILAEFNARNADAIETLRGKLNVMPRKFDDAVLRAIGDASGQVLMQAAENHPNTSKALQSFLDFRRKAVTWAKYGDQAYLNARLLPFKYGT